MCRARAKASIVLVVSVGVAAALTRGGRGGRAGAAVMSTADGWSWPDKWVAGKAAPGGQPSAVEGFAANGDCWAGSCGATGTKTSPGPGPSVGAGKGTDAVCGTGGGAATGRDPDTEGREDGGPIATEASAARHSDESFVETTALSRYSSTALTSA